MAKSTLESLRNVQLKRVMRHINRSASEKSSPERIAEALELNQEGVCDDCLSIAAQVTPRQQVNQICRGLVERGVIERSRRTCSVCRAEKLVNLPSKEPARQAESFSTSEIPDRLDQLRRQIVGILNSLENYSNKGEGLAARITRLRELGKLPAPVACMMQTLNSLRNIVVYEGSALNKQERAVVEAAWSAIKVWRA